MPHACVCVSDDRRASATPAEWASIAGTIIKALTPHYFLLIPYIVNLRCKFRASCSLLSRVKCSFRELSCGRALGWLEGQEARLRRPRQPRPSQPGACLRLRYLKGARCSGPAAEIDHPHGPLTVPPGLREVVGRAIKRRAKKREGTTRVPSLELRLRGSYSSGCRGRAEGLSAPDSLVLVAPVVTSLLRW